MVSKKVTIRCYLLIAGVAIVFPPLVAGQPSAGQPSAVRPGIEASTNSPLAAELGSWENSQLSVDSAIFTETERRKLALWRSDTIYSPEAVTVVVPGEEYLLREITLIRSENEPLDDFRHRIITLKTQLIERPEDFPRVAHDHSKSFSRRKSGLLTSLTLNQIDPAVRSAAQKLTILEIAEVLVNDNLAVIIRRELKPLQ